MKPNKGEMERLEVLITVKTYPIPSSKYDELVCTAGVTESGDFVRLYPINFRDLPYSQQFKKYQWIKLKATRRGKEDSRKESFRPDSDSIELIGEPIETERGDWGNRAKYALLKRAQSMEELSCSNERDNTSLGVFRPKHVFGLDVIEEDEKDWKPSQRQAFLQARLWETRTVSKNPPRKVPYKFFYRFSCDDPRCKGNHRMSIIDWEVGALFWRLVDEGKNYEQAADSVRHKFFNVLCGLDKFTYFFVGTIFPYNTWVVIGVFWPSKDPLVAIDGSKGRQLRLL